MVSETTPPAIATPVTALKWTHPHGVQKTLMLSLGGHSVNGDQDDPASSFGRCPVTMWSCC
jgi:hypothetical protein